MIERVALALKAKIGEAFDATPIPGSPAEWGDWSATGGMLNLEDVARAAIEAMREPTQEMLRAGWAAAHDEDAGDCWRDMIDAALKEDADH